MRPARSPHHLALLIGGWLCWAQAGAAMAPLADVVDRLAQRGHRVLFSSDLVAADTRLDLAEDSPQALARALAPLGLTLKRLDDHWVIARASPAATESRLTIRSAAGLAVEQAEARWRGQALALQADAQGVYTVPAGAGTLVTIRAAAHRPQLVRLAGPGQEVVLTPVRLVENVIVTGSRHHLSGRNVTGSVTTLDADDLATIPSLGNDSLRAAAQLPGMSTMGVSGKPRIRGGLQDELLVRLDGIELLDAYHLADFQNVFSVVDDRAVASVDVYTGGFPARYGNRMSGVMEINTARPDGRPRSELGISLFSLLANSHGAVQDGKTRYLASARRGNLDQITRVVNPDLGRPRYHNAFARLDRDLSADSTVSVGTFFTRDDVRLEEDETNARSDIDSRYLWTRVQHDHGGGLSSVHTLTYTWSDRHKQLADVDDDSERAGFLDHHQSLRKINGRSDLSWQRDAMLMEFGAELEYGRVRFDSVAHRNLDAVATLLTGQTEDGHAIRLDPEGFSGGAYWALELPLGETVLVQPGIRWDFQAYDPDGTTYHVSPRLGLQYDPAANLSLRLDIGRFHQPEALHELQVADGETRYARPQSSDHFIVGAEWINGAWELHAAAYEKRYRRTKRRYENAFNPFVLVPELEPDRVAISPDRARARGFDVELRRRLSERAMARVHYGYMDAEDHLNGQWVPRRWSQRHSAGAMLSWQAEQLTAALAVTWHSGWRGARLPETVSAGTVLDIADVLNNVELKDFLSVDASLRRSWQLGRYQLTAFASVTNLTNRNNLAGIEYDGELEDGMVSLEPGRETLIPLVPSVGILVSF